MAKVDRLLEGYERFYEKHFHTDKELFEQLATVGQMPKTLVIACSDSRVDPSILLDTKPGDIFVIRNVANLVPPYQPMGESYHGTSAALEFAVNHLKVEHIVILGHSGCAGIQTLMDNDDSLHSHKEFSFISSWVNIAKDAKERTIKQCNHSQGEQTYSSCEKEAIKTSIENLMTFPWIEDKVKKKEVEVHGWHFSLTNGKIEVIV